MVGRSVSFRGTVLAPGFTFAFAFCFGLVLVAYVEVDDGRACFCGLGHHPLGRSLSQFLLLSVYRALQAAELILQWLCELTVPQLTAARSLHLTLQFIKLVLRRHVLPHYVLLLCVFVALDVGGNFLWMGDLRFKSAFVLLLVLLMFALDLNTALFSLLPVSATLVDFCLLLGGLGYRRARKEVCEARFHL